MYQRARNTEREGQAPFSEEARHTLVIALEELLDGREPEAFVSLDVGEATGTLVVVADAAHLVQIDGRTIDVRFLGQLSGGSYAERFELGEFGVRVTCSLEHRELPAALEFAIEPDRPQHVHREPGAHERDAQLKLLRHKLREWSRRPPPR